MTPLPLALGTALILAIVKQVRDRERTNTGSGFVRSARPASAHESSFFVQCFEWVSSAVKSRAATSASGDRTIAPFSTGQFRST